MKNGKIQCKDIPDEEFLLALIFTISINENFNPQNWRMRWEVKENLEAVRGPIPEKVFLAKAKKLIKAKKLGGCDCGCRGDYHLPCNRVGCCVESDSPKVSYIMKNLYGGE